MVTVPEETIAECFFPQIFFFSTQRIIFCAGTSRSLPASMGQKRPTRQRSDQ